MHRRLLLVSPLPLALLAGWSSATAGDLNPLLRERWQTRPLVVVVPAADDPMLTQLAADLRQPAVRVDFDEREMLLFTVVAGAGRRAGQPLAPGETRALLQALAAAPDAPATAYLVGKDGGVKRVERGRLVLGEVFTLIDGMPMRRR